jgi:hypothetical protein
MLTKIVLTEGEYVETPWAEALGEDRFRLANLPFWKYDVSIDDIVEAIVDDSGRPAFVRVLEKSGNRTVRVRLQPPMDVSPESKAVIDALVHLGCDFEGMHPGYIAVNVPPGVRLDAVAERLETSGQDWEYADPAPDESEPDTNCDAHEA